MTTITHSAMTTTARTHMRHYDNTCYHDDDDNTRCHDDNNTRATVTMTTHAAMTVTLRSEQQTLNTRSCSVRHWHTWPRLPLNTSITPTPFCEATANQTRTRWWHHHREEAESVSSRLSGVLLWRFFSLCRLLLDKLRTNCWFYIQKQQEDQDCLLMSQDASANQRSCCRLNRCTVQTETEFK